jgi:SAM-dependent methyltransferase
MATRRVRIFPGDAARVADDVDTRLLAYRADQDIPLLPTTAGAGSNWLWLADLARWNATLELDLDGSRLGPDLVRHFADVKFHTIAPGSRLPFRRRMFDCVTLNGVLERLVSLRSVPAATILRPLFAECRRVLRTGGCLYVGTGDVEPRVGKSRWLFLIERPLVVDRLLREAGFSPVHSYWVDPCLDRPYVIVPATRRSLLARERALANCVGPDFRRVMAVRLGVPEALYPARISLGYS